MIRFIFFLASLFILLMFLMGFSVVRTFRSLFFGGGNKRKTQQYKQNRQNTSYRQQSRKEYTNLTPKKKIIPKDEGEYVDYEEIK